ncbi:MAG: hypothetical protein ACREJQ_01815 [bacterium]
MAIGNPLKTLKACVTCKHFHVDQQGEEVAGLRDTYFLDESCNVFGWKYREYPLMAPVRKDAQGRVVISTEPFDCPFWEPLE